MTDFLITEMTLYPWFTWLVVVLAIGGVAWWSVLLGQGVAFVSDWSGKKRETWRYKTMVMRELREHPDGDDPPEYQHPDGDDDLDYCEHGVIGRTCTRCGYDGLGEDWDAMTREDWSPGVAWGPGPVPHETRTDMAGLAEVLAKAEAMGLLEEEGPSVPPRCNDPECDKYGWVHPPPCLTLPTMPVPKFTEGPAMPPQPVREYLHPRIMDDLSAAGFSEHETNEGAVESAWTRAHAMDLNETIAQITDGIVPID